MELTWLEWIALLEYPHRAAFLKGLSHIREIEVRSIAEIGVDQGNSSRLFRSFFPEAKLFLIDPWALYPGYLNENAGPVSQNARDYEHAYAAVKEAFQGDPNCAIVRMTSEDAASEVPGGLDLVFIDANHSYEYVKLDIRLWLPKVRTGGLIAGHDFNPARSPGVCRAVGESFGAQFGIGPDATWFHQKL